jgi:hypothetical protein
VTAVHTPDPDLADNELLCTLAVSTGHVLVGGGKDLHHLGTDVTLSVGETVPITRHGQQHALLVIVHGTTAALVMMVGRRDVLLLWRWLLVVGRWMVHGGVGVRDHGRMRRLRTVRVRFVVLGGIVPADVVVTAAGR